MYRVPFVDAHLSKIALWSDLFGRVLPDYILFRCEESCNG